MVLFLFLCSECRFNFTNFCRYKITDYNIEQVENWCDRNNVQLVCPINDSIEEEMQPYFTSAPAFGGKACDVIDCIVVYSE
jgi:hypothetical protein